MTVFACFGVLVSLALLGSAGGQTQPPPPELPRVEAPPLGPASGDPADNKLRPVPFPADGEPPLAAPPTRHRRIRTTIADLRDPFAQPAGRRGSRRGVGSAHLSLPDLKDPFRATARIQPKNWKVPRVPGDIRDPFSPALNQRRLRKISVPGCEPVRTDDGVLIQRPSTLRESDTGPNKSKDDGCIRMVPKDLRDPFAKR